MQILITSLNIKYVQIQWSMRLCIHDYHMIKKELESYIIADKIVRVSNNYI